MAESAAAPEASPAPAMPKIVFDDAIHPAHEGQADGYPGLPVKSEQPAGLSEKSTAAAVAATVRDINDEERARVIADQDLGGSRKQIYSGRVLAWLAFQSTGIIYGDIGTSPLYVYSSTFTENPSRDDLIGALSIIIWSLTLIVTVKYTFIVLAADDDGQGGTFALYSLLARYMRLPGAAGSGNVRSGRDGADEQAMLAGAMNRYRTNELPPASRGLRRFLEGSHAMQQLLKVAGVIGVSMVMADGVLTPAQSVLGAVQGLRVASPGLSTATVVGVSCAILVVLFALQPLGTARLGTGFAPIVSVWLLFNAAVGIYNLAVHDHGRVLVAFNPAYAFHYLTRNGEQGWRSLGGMLLAFTGVEALFADLGAFSQRAIQISWLALAFPCLLLAYAGQAAYIVTDASGTAYSNPFFYSLPPGSLYFGLVIAVLAAIVASQAMITSTFQLLVQLMRLSYFPHIRVVHTSRRFHEQVYVPFANWLLMVGTIIVTAVYNNTTSLGNAYGVCVISVTMLTTCMVSLVALIVWRLPLLLVAPIFLAFAALDGAYLTAVLTKVPDGAWFTVLLAALLSSIFVLWRFGKETQWRSEAQDRLPATALLTCTPNSRNPHGTLRLASEFGHTPLATVPGLGIFFDKEGYRGGVLPPAFTHFVRKFATRPTVIVFFHMRPLDIASVPSAERYVVTRVLAGHGSGRDGVSDAAAASPNPLLPNCYAVVLRHGYADDVLHPDMAHDLVEVVSKAMEDNPAAVETLRESELSQIVYIRGREALRISKPLGAARRSPLRLARHALLALFLWIRDNSRTKLADLDINMDRLVEVGFVKEM